MTPATTFTTQSPLSRITPTLEGLLPGLTLVAIVTAAAYGLRQVPAFAALSPMISAIFIGMIFANFTSVPKQAEAGVAFAGRTLLRAAVALLGLQLTLDHLGAVGGTGLLIIGATVVATYGFTIVLGRVLGVDAPLTRLLAAGTSICGASAIAAANAVDRARDEDVAYAVACVTLFGTAAMFLYPLLLTVLPLDATGYGLWTGASVHEVAQVVAAGYQAGTETGEFSVVAKLTRVLMLAPVLVTAAMLVGRSAGASKGMRGGVRIIPVFVIAFIALMLANSFGLVPEMVSDTSRTMTPILLSAGLAALGLGTRFTNLKARGLRPLLLAFVASVFISGFSLGLILLTA